MKEFIKIIAFYGIYKHFYSLNDKYITLKCCQIRLSGNMKGVFCTVACSCWTLFVSIWILLFAIGNIL